MRAASVACLQVAACAALTNIPYIERVRDALLSERARLFEQLQQVSWLEPYPSQANFILCKVLEVRVWFEPPQLDMVMQGERSCSALHCRSVRISMPCSWEYRPVPLRAATARVRLLWRASGYVWLLRLLQLCSCAGP